jgi:hypothetical protein
VKHVKASNLEGLSMFAPEGIPGRSVGNPRAQIRASALRSILRPSARQLAPVVAALLFMLGVAAPTATAQTLPAPREILPPDAQPTAAIPSVLFGSWFTSAAPTVNGLVKPANSLLFSNPPKDNLPFYNWAEQMFLWLTSPVPKEAGGDGGIVLNSPEFYTVSDEQDGKRTLSRNKPGQKLVFPVRAEKPGPNSLPVIYDVRGRMFEVINQSRKHARPVVKNKQGEEVPVAKIVLDKRGYPTFYDSNGKPIDNPRPVDIPQDLRHAAVVERIEVRGVSAFLTYSGEAIIVGVAQAKTGLVLLTQNQLPVFYMIFVNDGFAFFSIGVQGGEINPTPTHFPTTPADFIPVVEVAKNHGKPLAHPCALCLAVKTSWVEASQLPHSDGYIKMKACFPTYDKTTNPTHWKPNGVRNADLALVGLHIAGSVNGHAEMIWATFEHLANCPNGTYEYYANSTTSTTVPQNTTGAWLLCQSGAGGMFNQSQAAFSNGKIRITSATPAEVIRFKPFGASWPQRPNPNVRDSADSNTQIISLNNSVRAQLNGDTRTNYIMLGATWTDGNAPTYPFDETCNNVVGTSQLTNSTMETFSATDSLYNRDTNCFACHRNTAQHTGTAVTTDVSHVFGTLDINGSHK